MLSAGSTIHAATAEEERERERGKQWKMSNICGVAREIGKGKREERGGGGYWTPLFAAAEIDFGMAKKAA